MSSDALASAGAAGMAARRQPVAVLFADIRGFTRLSESLGTEATIELLTEFHQLVTRIVFDHRGTLEKYIGDAVMATFGTPSRGARRCRRALQCAWQVGGRDGSLERGSGRDRGQASVDIGIGVHYGEAVLGKHRRCSTAGTMSWSVTPSTWRVDWSGLTRRPRCRTRGEPMR